MKIVLPHRVQEAIRSHARNCHPKECCGVILGTDGRIFYQTIRNTSPAPDSFVLDPQQYVAVAREGTILGVVHSHTDQYDFSAWAFSDEDIKRCEQGKTPWFLHIPNGEVVSWTPKSWPPKLLGREFFHGFSDCYTFIRDFYQLKFLELNDFPRDDDWWNNSDGVGLYERGLREHAQQCKEVALDPERLKPGDCLFMKVNCAVVNHAAIYHGDGQIAHHFHGRLSCMEPYSLSWQRRTHKVLRPRL